MVVVGMGLVPQNLTLKHVSDGEVVAHLYLTVMVERIATCGTFRKKPFSHELLEFLNFLF